LILNCYVQLAVSTSLSRQFNQKVILKQWLTQPTIL